MNATTQSTATACKSAANSSAQGIDPRRAEMLSQARIFGVAPGEIGGTGYYYLVERSGQWDARKDLMDAYLGFSRYVYTEGLWGKQRRGSL